MRVFRSPLPLATCLALIAGCSTSPRAPQGDAGAAPASKPAATRQLAQRFPSQELRAEMRRLYVLTEELKRRANRGQLGAAPGVVLQVATDMPRYAAPKAFLAGLEDLRQRAAALTKTKVPAADYGKLVASCVSCHAQLAPQLVGHVQKLKLDAALASAPPPAPAPPRAAPLRPRTVKRPAIGRRAGPFLSPSDGMVR